MGFYRRTSPHVDAYGVTSSVERKEWFVGGLYQALQSSPYSLYFFIGAEILNLTCSDVKNPRTEVPFAQVGAMAAMFALSIAVLFICCSMQPGTADIQEQLMPMSDGFQHIFTGLSEENAGLLAVILLMDRVSRVCWATETDLRNG